MNNLEFDQLVLSGEWVQMVEGIAEAMKRYRKTGIARKGTYIDGLWVERIDLLEQAVEVGQ